MTTLPEQNTIALIYDFDGTLTPKAMQEYTVLREFCIDSEKFWADVKKVTRAQQADEILTYMRLMLDRIRKPNQQQQLTRCKLQGMAKNVEYFHGVDSWFERISEYVDTESSGAVCLQQYIISAGLKEIIDATCIAPHFARIYASEYYYDTAGHAVWPNLIINDTNKTQFLFRINKGREDLALSINEHTPEEERPIPFENMMYVGDGETDVPCMTVVRKYGGYSVAVYNEAKDQAKTTCEKLLTAERIDFFAIADYSDDSPLDRQVKLMLDVMIARILQKKDATSCRSIRSTEP